MSKIEFKEQTRQRLLQLEAQKQQFTQDILAKQFDIVKAYIEARDVDLKDVNLTVSEDFSHVLVTPKSGQPQGAPEGPATPGTEPEATTPPVN